MANEQKVAWEIDLASSDRVLNPVRVKKTRRQPLLFDHKRCRAEALRDCIILPSPVLMKAGVSGHAGTSFLTTVLTNPGLQAGE